MPTLRPRHARAFLLPLTLALIAGCADGVRSSDSVRAPAPAPVAAPVETAKAPAHAEIKPMAVVAAPAEDEAPKTGYALIKGKKEVAPKIALGDPRTIARILDEGKNRNQVMEHLTYISNEIGPRLTGSTNQEKAAEWAKAKFESWGLKAELWQWGTIPVRFDRGPSVGRVVNGDRTIRELEFTTPAWAAGTPGAVRGPVVKMPENEKQFEEVKDKIKGSWLLVKSNAGGRRGVVAGGNAAGRARMFANIRRKWAGQSPIGEERPAAAEPFAKDGVSGLYQGTVAGGRADGRPVGFEIRKGEGNAITGGVRFGESGRLVAFKDGTYNAETGEIKFMVEGRGNPTYTLKLKDGALTGESKPEEGDPSSYTAKLADASKDQEEGGDAKPSLEERILKEGPAGFISASSDDRVRTGGSFRNVDADNPPVDCEVQVRVSDYDYLNSRVADGATVHVEFDLPHTFTKGPIPVHNVIAEIPGTQWPDEVVVVSAHLDSWNGPGSQGTTDNGTGSSVTLEAARLLATAKAKPKRTIRFILWTGEEQGLLGSAAYVKMLKETGQIEKVSACFVDDGGTNYEGGLQCLDSQVEFLAAATAPVNGNFYCEVDKKFLDVNIRAAARAGGGMAGGSSDHASFQRAGAPGFFWDEVGRADYQYGWHTQNDKLNLAIPIYLQQSSTCAAITGYNLACAPTLLPREALKKPEEKKEGPAAEEPAEVAK